MKAVVYDKLSKDQPFHYTEIELPILKEDEVLIRIIATSVNALDYRSIQMGSIPKNKIFGADVAGRVVQMGSQVSLFHVGDAVFGDISESGLGGFAEYAAVKAHTLVQIPDGVSFLDAAALPVSGLTALQGLRNQGNIQSGQRVLIYGAGGGVGTFAVQLAKHFGAHVTAVCGTQNVTQTQKLGADEVIDYRKENVFDRNQHYDLILGINGNQPLRIYHRSLAKHGKFVMVGGALSQVFKSIFFGPFFSMGSKKIKFLMAKPNPEDLRFLIELLQQGIIKPVIEKVYPLSETAEAVSYLEKGHARGKIVISISENETILPKFAE